MSNQIVMFSDETLKSIANMLYSNNPLEGYLFFKNKALTTSPEIFSKYLRQFMSDQGIQQDIPIELYKTLKEQETRKIEEVVDEGYYILRRPLKDEIARRYKIVNLGYTFSSGEIVDNTLPTIYHDNDCFDMAIRQSLIYRESYRAFTLSRLFEALYGITRIPLRTQLSILGYKIPEIRKWIQEIIKRRLTVTFVGLGGMNLNVIENLLELCKDLGINNLFKRLIIYENDDLEYHNTLRFSTTSLLQIKEKTIDTKNCLKDFIPFSKCFLYHYKELSPLSTEVHISRRKLHSGDIYRQDIYFGAPDMETREAFFKAGVPFFCAIHQNNTVSLWYQPKVDLSMQSETYGRIMLMEFFLNILDVTIQFIKALAENEEYDKDFCIYKNTFNAYEQLNNKGFIIPNYTTRSI